MHEFCSVQCADSTYWCDYLKCSRQVAINARRCTLVVCKTFFKKT